MQIQRRINKLENALENFIENRGHKTKVFAEYQGKKVFLYDYGDDQPRILILTAGENEIRQWKTAIANPSVTAGYPYDVSRVLKEFGE